MRESEIREGLGELADRAERDHEVQMARADCYKIAKYAIKLHDMLQNVTEEQGLEGWVQSKITKAADYLGSVYHHLDYESATGEINDNEVSQEKPVPELGEARDTHCSDKCCGSDVKAEDCTCPPTCKHCNCNAVSEGRMSDQIIGDSETMSKEEFAKKYGKEMADEYYESVKEGKSPHKKGTKKYKKHMAAMHAESLQDRLAAKLESKKKTDERSLTKSEKGKQEKYVKGMKKAKGDFKDRYGKDAEAVMYATATKMAKKK
jgi:hypothetical protein